MHYWRQLGWTLISFMMLCVTAACAVQEPDYREIPAPKVTVATQSLTPLQTAAVVYLGEHHDSEADHQAQLEIIQALHAHNPKVAIAMEMFQRPFQSVLDQYIAGKISEAELIAQTEYEKRWGFPWELYAPILRFAREKKIPVLAINAPNEVVRQVSSQGLDSLTAEDYRYIPPRAELDLTNVNYRSLMESAFTGIELHQGFNLDNFFAAQIVWDETMAQAIATFRRQHPDTQVITLAGEGHVIYGYGIPDRVKRRLGIELQQQIVLLNPTPEQTINNDGIADMFWYTKQ